MVDQRVIVDSKSALDLGVIIDCSLTWKEQIDSTCLRVFRAALAYQNQTSYSYHPS